METTIMAISLEPRTHNAPKFQEVLTRHGCIIKMRLGLHETTKTCSERGLILLQLCGEDDELKALNDDLHSVEGVKINSMTI